MNCPKFEIFLRLDNKFALGADDLQWILYKAVRAVAFSAPLKPVDWRRVSFVSFTKEVLLRCMREIGCKPLHEAQVVLDGYPDTFRAWKAAGAARNSPGSWYYPTEPELASPGPRERGFKP